MLMHGHGFVRPQVFLKNADPLVLQLQVRVLRIGRQRIGACFVAAAAPRAAAATAIHKNARA